MKIYVLNGPNLNMLGIREPDKYGTDTYPSLCKMIEEHCKKRGVECVLYQSNHEGDLVDKIQEAYFDKADGIVINPGAYTHTSIALLDAVKATSLPCVEVHISKVEEREDFRHKSYTAAKCVGVIAGFGAFTYRLALLALVNHLDSLK